MLKQLIIDHIIDVEGGYVNDQSDSGGETNFGITYDVARANGFMGDMKNLPRSLAFDIYSGKYWDSVCGDAMVKLSEAITEEVVDTAVNMGPSRAGGFLQRSLNSLNNAGALYSDLVVDGAIGPATLAALQSYLKQRDSRALLRALNCLQGAFYIELSERREKDEKFVYGWLMNRVII